MIEKVKISNFKSVQELELELGRLNIFIGENGCGKTSILEGIAMGSAAAQNKLDDEFLISRGIRVVESKLMKSAFDKNNIQTAIEISFLNSQESPLGFDIDESTGINGRWGISKFKHEDFLVDKIESLPTLPALFDEYIKTQGVDISRNDIQYREIISRQFGEQIVKPFSAAYHNDYKLNYGIESYMLFAPENYFLRRFEEEGQIRPLGIRGEGLFRHLVELSKQEPETFKAIADELKLIDWYEGFSIPTDLNFSERRISITDRFISDTIKDFDQRSANEGFLYLLFYFTLFLSKYTPKFFAIDNIDNALNPRLCTKLVETLARLAKEQDKQAILTTHNPAILDGLDLHDDEQRLFVIYRNDDGETKARRIMPLKQVEGQQKVRLSEAFVRGYLGGLPSNF